MPSLEHSSLVLLFQNRPELALELLQQLGVRTEAAGPGSIESIDLSAAVPAEYRADLVLRYAGGKRPLVIPLEVQNSRDPEKRYSWPAYAVLARARFRCDVELVVLAPSRAVARWCARPIPLGNKAVFTPTVIGPDSVPVVTDLEQARAAPELVVLSALAHGRGELNRAVAIGLAGLHAARALETDRGILYNDLVLWALSQAAREVIEAMIPEGYVWKSEFARKHIAEGEARGEVRGEVRGRARALMLVLESRGIALTASESDRIGACTDANELERWLRRAVTAKTASELFD